MSVLNISVIIPTFNPKQQLFDDVLNALKIQTLPLEKWELIIIDNNSTNGVLNDINIGWHTNAKLITENRQGLTFSRIAGFSTATADIVLMVDDDNILAPNYLENVLEHFDQYPQVGSLGGNITACFIEHEPESWTKQFWGMLAIRDLGNKKMISTPQLLDSYPPYSPVGAGMAVRRHLFTAYVNALNSANEIFTDRTGDTLSSGGDNEINIYVLKQGFSVAYFPDLTLKHIIPQSRLTRAYLAELNYQSSRSWIRLLFKHNICPWKKIPANTVLIRKIKAWFSCKAWLSNANYISWRGACGTYESLAEA